MVRIGDGEGMAREDNLKARSPSEARKLGAKGGRASGEARRKKRAMRERLQALLDGAQGGESGADALAAALFNGLRERTRTDAAAGATAYHALVEGAADSEGMALAYKELCDLAARFGVAIEHNNYEQFYIARGQHYTPCTYNIEGDWSGASCLLVAGATAGSITIRNLNHISLQADLAIIEALARAGAEIITTNSSVTVHGGPLHAFEFDATDCPDLFPALAALAASCEGTSVLTGTQRLTYKESNRAETIAEVFGRLGIGVDLSEENTMRITGGPVSSAVVDSHNDHRIAMAAAVAALSSDDSVVIEGADAADKSYPNFWNDLDTLRS